MMKIRMIETWRGYLEGRIYTIGENISVKNGEYLLKKRLAIPAKPEKKYIGAPPRDKMMRGAPKQKR